MRVKVGEEVRLSGGAGGRRKGERRAGGAALNAGQWEEEGAWHRPGGSGNRLRPIRKEEEGDTEGAIGRGELHAAAAAAAP